MEGICRAICGTDIAGYNGGRRDLPGKARSALELGRHCTALGTRVRARVPSEYPPPTLSLY
eukprot:2300262-Rhodomonas_salina.3